MIDLLYQSAGFGRAGTPSHMWKTPIRSVSDRPPLERYGGTDVGQGHICTHDVVSTHSPHSKLVVSCAEASCKDRPQSSVGQARSGLSITLLILRLINYQLCTRDQISIKHNSVRPPPLTITTHTHTATSNIIIARV